MLLYVDELRDIFCVEKVKKKVSTWNCSYPELYDSEQIFYASATGVVLCSLFFLLHACFWSVNSIIRTDFTKCFMSAVALPLSIAWFFKYIFVWMAATGTAGTGFHELINLLYMVSVSVSLLTLVFGLVCYLFMETCFYLGQDSPKNDDNWAIFFTIEIGSWLLSGCYHTANPDYRLMPVTFIVIAMILSMIIMVIAAIAAIFSMVCGVFVCSGTQQKAFPSILRLGLAIAFLLISIGPLIYALTLISDDMANKTPESFSYDPQITATVYFSYRILAFFWEPFLLLSVFILPAYHEPFLRIIMGRKGGKWAEKSSKASRGGSANSQTPLVKS